MFTLGLLLAWLVVCFVHPRVFTVIIFNKMIPAGCLLLMGARILDRNSVQVPWAKFALAIAALSAWGQFYPIACIRHTFWGVVPMIGMFMYFLWDRFRIDSRLMLGCLAIFVFPLALVRFAEARDHLRLAEDAWSVPGPLYGMRPYRSKDLPHYATKSDCEGFEMLRRCVVDNGGTREVTLYGVDAMLALITDNHLNPGPFHVTWTGLSEFGCFEDRERVMAERSPLLAVQGQWLGGEGLGQFQSRGYRVLCRVFAFGSDVYLLGR
jgi:hypothetical protein